MAAKSQKILFTLTSHDGNGQGPSGFYLSEATHPHKVLSEVGHPIDFVSPKGGQAPVDPASFDLEDEVNAAFWNDASLRHQIESTARPSDLDAAEYAAIFYVGGHAALWDFPDNVELAQLASRIYERGGVVGAVCHGPAGLLNVRLDGGKLLVEGKDVAAFTNDEERAVKLDQVVPFFLADELVRRGARHQPAPDWETKVVISERLVTGQNPASASGVGQGIAALLRRVGKLG
jgi:putative intracellular protease/amidase